MSVLTKTPLRTFTLISLALIAAMVASVGLVQSTFYRNAVLQREGIIIRDIAQALASRQLSLLDLDIFREVGAQRRFERSFAILKNLSEAVRIKVYNRRQDLVWSDDSSLIGENHKGDTEIARAMAGRTETVFYAAHSTSDHEKGLNGGPVVEFYVPFFVKESPQEKPSIGGVFAFYRAAETLNQTIAAGSILIWLTTALGGLALYGGLFSLFRTVYRRQLEAESRLVRLSSEHKRIVQLEKLSAIGTMVGEIAHQINNPLVGVTNMAQLAEREAENPERVRELLKQIRQAGEHCRTFVQRMLDFTKVSKFRMVPADLGKIVAETISLFKQSTGEHIDVVTELPREPVKMMADPNLLRHALFNLLTNAGQAAPGGTITVEVASENRDEDGTRGWRLSVFDEGPGLPETPVERLFEPFYTTRSKGVGLGLPVVQNIAILHGGRVTAHNRPKGGAQFTIWLPEQAGETRDKA